MANCSTPGQGVAVRVCLPVALTLALAVGAAACDGTRSSVTRLGGDGKEYRGHVTLNAAAAPADSEVVGAVEVESTESLDDGLAAFAARVGEVGGDHGQVDRYWTTFDTRSVTRTETYSCGDYKTPRVCTRTSTRQEPVVISHYVGRAMRTVARTQ